MGDNWKTTISGLVGGLGALLSIHPDPTVAAFGKVLVFIGTVFLGYHAKDVNH